MEPFLKAHHYHFIHSQARNLVKAYSNSTDPNVIRARIELTQENVFRLFPNLSEEQRQLLLPIVTLKDKEELKAFLLRLSPYMLPFPAITEQTIKRLFPKVKKLKAPALTERTLAEASYVSWLDLGSNQKCIVALHRETLVGLHGTFAPLSKKGVCSICNHLEEIGMFVQEVKRSGDGTFLKKGNYICQDSETCNRNITSLEKLDAFLATMVRTK